MKNLTVITLNQALSMFNYEGVCGSLIANCIAIKSNIDTMAEGINKKREDSRKSAKPLALDALITQLKDLLAAAIPDDKKIMIVQASINILQQEWQEKAAEADKEVLNATAELSADIKKIAFADFEQLKRERKELVDLEAGKRQVITTNQFTTDHLLALSLIVEMPK